MRPTSNKRARTKAPPKFHRRPRHQRPGEPVRPTGEDTTLIYGIHAVAAALANPQREIGTLWLTENAAHRLQKELAERQITVNRCTPRDLDKRLDPDTVHQGALLETAELPAPTLHDIAATSEATNRPAVILDQVTDPHNVGAILRSAAVFGTSGLIMTRRHSPPLGGALAKSASGALERVPIARVQNLARAIDELRGLGVTILGLEGDSTHVLEDETFAHPTALILGAEGKGLRQSTKAACDRLCRITADGPIASLNVSNAAAIALHHAAQMRQTKK